MRAILTYHSIDASGSAISVHLETFRSHVRWLAGSGVRVVPVEELLRLPPEAEALALTFDDGFANFAQLAWPLLRDHGMPVTLFVATDFVGGSNSWSVSRRIAVPRLPLLDWEELGRLVEEGVALGSHSRTHPDMRGLSAAALREEVEGSASRLEAKTGRAPTGFAYPFGYYDAAAVEAVRGCYAWACTVELRMLRTRENPWLTPRLDAYYLRSPGRLEAWGTRRLRRHLWLRAGARRVRNTLSVIAGRR
ncbi:MAG TPA: polysaccharide deacetylase family protein [Longimicrobiaceae bacterium]|nr:polysaccharide deacetylase family protein [Longimicrobiaceae bacterium]